MVDIRTGLMCKKCRDWPKIELRLAKRRAWGSHIQRMIHDHIMCDEDLLAALLRMEDPEILDKLDASPPSDLSGDRLMELVGIK